MIYKIAQACYTLYLIFAYRTLETFIKLISLRTVGASVEEA